MRYDMLNLASAFADDTYVNNSCPVHGIEAAAHNGPLAGGTIAVIAGGIDSYYPPKIQNYNR